MSHPKVSICIPCYNGMPHLRATFESILAQTYENLEIIYVDDVSTDGSYALACEFQQRDQRIIVHKNEKNLKLHGNWNKALKLCTGEFIKLLCADDIIYPSSVEEQVRILQDNPGISVISSDSDIIDYKGRKIFCRLSPLPHGVPLSKEKVFRACLKKGTNIVGEPSVLLMRAAAVKSAPAYDPALKYAIDLDHIFSLLDHGALWVHPNIGASFRMHTGSLTNSGLSIAEKELVHCLKKHNMGYIENIDLNPIRRMRRLKALFLTVINNPLGRAVLRKYACFKYGNV